MTSHARHPDDQSRHVEVNGPDTRLWHALCGRYVPSWSFCPSNECACQQCRDAAMRIASNPQRQHSSAAPGMRDVPLPDDVSDMEVER